MTAIADRIEAAGIKRPINWSDMGSSEKDLWEERQIRYIETIESEDEGAYGIHRVVGTTPGAITCGTCARSWLEDITPAGRCPWESEHDEEDGDDLDEEGPTNTSFRNSEEPLDVWLRFEPEDADDDDAEASHEANTYLDDDNRFRVEWSHTAVGQISERTFDTYAEAKSWLEEGGYTDYTS